MKKWIAKEFLQASLPLVREVKKQNPPSQRRTLSGTLKKLFLMGKEVCLSHLQILP
jgi:hypothetical protein